MQIEPYAGDVAVYGPSAPNCEQIEDLIRFLVTIHHRWGNTAIRYRIQWGASALWAEDAQKREIDKLKKQIKTLKTKLARMTHAGRCTDALGAK